MHSLFKCSGDLKKALAAARDDIDLDNEVLFENLSMAEAYDVAKSPISYGEKKNRVFIFSLEPNTDLTFLVAILKITCKRARFLIVCDKYFPNVLYSHCGIIRVPRLPTDWSLPIYIGTGRTPPELNACLKNFKRGDVMKIAKKCHRYKASFINVCHAIIRAKPESTSIVAEYQFLLINSDKYISCLTEMLILIFF
jgi:hypothetical protein